MPETGSQQQEIMGKIIEGNLPFLHRQSRQNMPSKTQPSNPYYQPLH